MPTSTLTAISRNVARAFSSALSNSNALLSNLSLPAKCALVLLLILGLHSALLLVASSRGHAQLLQEQQTLMAEQWVTQIASLSREGLLRNDRVTLLSVLRQQAENPLLGYARVADSDDQTLVEVGLPNDQSRRFHSPVHIGPDIAGQVSLELHDESLRAAQRQLQWQLFLLCGLLLVLATALAAAFGGRLDTLFQAITRNHRHPTETPGYPAYKGNDSLGDMLNTLAPPEPVLPTLQRRQADWIVLHIHWQHFQRLTQQWGKAELERRLTRSYQAALALARLYNASVKIHRRDGITLRFTEQAGADHPLLRALCSAHLMQLLDASFGARAALGSVRGEGSQFQLEAQEVRLVEVLAACEGSAIQIQLPGDLSGEILEWAESSPQGLVVKERYRQLLQRQFEKLSGQLDAS